jgi:hypothetical protein
MLEYSEWVFGGYKNSFSDLSVIAARKVDWQHEKWNYGFIAGGVTGYEYGKLTLGSITPFAAPYVSYDLGEIKPTILILGSAVTLSVGFSF